MKEFLVDLTVTMIVGIPLIIILVVWYGLSYYVKATATKHGITIRNTTYPWDIIERIIILHPTTPVGIRIFLQIEGEYYQAVFTHLSFPLTNLTNVANKFNDVVSQTQHFYSEKKNALGVTVQWINRSNIEKLSE